MHIYIHTAWAELCIIHVKLGFPIAIFLVVLLSLFVTHTTLAFWLAVVMVELWKERVYWRPTAGRAKQPAVGTLQTWPPPSSVPTLVRLPWPFTNKYTQLPLTTGKLYYLQDGGECVERGKIEGQPLFLRLHNPRQILVVVTHDMMLTEYSVTVKGEITILINVCLHFLHLLNVCKS